MNPFDDPPVPQQPQEPQAPESEQHNLDDLASRIVVHPPEPPDPSAPAPPISIDLNAFAPAPAPPPPPALSFLPDDLRISWSWLHLLFFALFTFGSLLLIQISIVIYFAAGHALTQKQMEEIFQTKPGVAIGSNVLWFLMVFLFLYVTLALIHERPFWRTLGWKKLNPAASAPSNPWLYFAGGIGLSLCVNFATYFVKPHDHLPIEDLFKSRTGAFLLMAMAVLVAPLIEETVFRGYLYPLFASSFSRVAMKFGGDPAAALRTGTALGIALTGTLFGLLHGAQLGWTWGLVAMLVTVGIVFTFARARAGTVLASFLLHLGYNSMIAFTAIFATHGFTRMPPHP